MMLTRRIGSCVSVAAVLSAVACSGSLPTAPTAVATAGAIRGASGVVTVRPASVITALKDETPVPGGSSSGTGRDDKKSEPEKADDKPGSGGTSSGSGSDDRKGEQEKATAPEAETRERERPEIEHPASVLPGAIVGTSPGAVSVAAAVRSVQGLVRWVAGVCPALVLTVGEEQIATSHLTDFQHGDCLRVAAGTEVALSVHDGEDGGRALVVRQVSRAGDGLTDDATQATSPETWQSGEPFGITGLRLRQPVDHRAR